MPLRILHVTPYAAGAWAYGGIPRVVDSLGRALVRAGHAVTVLTTDVATADARRLAPSGRQSRFRQWEAATVTDGLSTHVCPNLSNRLAYHAQFFTPVGLGRFLAEHAGDFDVAHLHACRNLPGVLAARHLVKAGVPYVLAPNGTAPLIERRRTAKRLFDAVAGRRVLDGASCVLAVSRAEARDLHALGVQPERVRLIANPVELHEGRAPERGAFRCRVGTGDGPLVLFLGKLTPRKRVEDLVEAVAHTGRPDISLVIAGNDMGAGRSIRSAVQACGLGHQTVFTGLVDGQNRIDALADADLVVYPSEHEAFGLVPLEALLAGTPVIVSGDSGSGEVVRTTGGGLVVPVGDTQALSQAILTMLVEKDAWRARAHAAARRVHDLYAPGLIAGQLAGVYDDLVRSPARAQVPQEARPGVSFVVPVKNGAPWLRRAVLSIQAQNDGRPFEIIAVEDGSTDGTVRTLEELSAAGSVTVTAGPRRGVAAAINVGIRAARFPLVAQVDQDVELEPGWLARMAAALEDPAVGAAQGRYQTAPRAGFFGRVMGLDLAQRYAAIRGRATDHVCTGNTLYRASALHSIGLFDESLGYGADNDVSYRLQRAGYRLVFCRAARAVHHWRDSLSGYCRQQYGFGYGRLDVVSRHPSRVRGDRVSPAAMMLHPALLALALLLVALASASAAAGLPWRGPALWSAILVTMLGLERGVAGLVAAYRFRDPAALAFPFVHLLRDAVWVGAIVTWTARRLAGHPPRPAHSMQPREAIASSER